MLSQANFLTEFLSEVNLVLAQADYGNKLYDLLTPIRNILLKEKELLGFSLARYCGADTRLAFTCEWIYQSNIITQNPNSLFIENQEFFRKKIPLKLRGVPNLHQIIDKHIEQIFQPQQIAFLHSKTKEIIQDIVHKNPYLNTYLNNTFLSQFIAGRLIDTKKLYVESVTITEYLETKAASLSFAQIGLPCLLGFSYTFNQPDNPVNPKGIKWVLLEEILRAISALHQTATGNDLQEFLYLNSLSEKEEFEWWQLEDNTKMKLSLSNSEARESAKHHREKIYSNALNNLQALIFPDKYKDMLKDLVEWAYQLS